MIEKIMYGRQDYRDKVFNPTAVAICSPTLVTNKRSYGPYPESVSPDSVPCEYNRWEVMVPKNKNFNDWFNSEYFVFSDEMRTYAIAGFNSEVDMQDY